MRGKPGVPLGNPLELERRTNKFNPHFYDCEIKTEFSHHSANPTQE